MKKSKNGIYLTNCKETVLLSGPYTSIDIFNSVAPIIIKNPHCSIDIMNTIGGVLITGPSERIDIKNTMLPIQITNALEVVLRNLYVEGFVTTKDFKQKMERYLGLSPSKPSNTLVLDDIKERIHFMVDQYVTATLKNIDFNTCKILVHQELLDIPKEIIGVSEVELKIEKRNVTFKPMGT